MGVRGEMGDAGWKADWGTDPGVQWGQEQPG